MLPRHLLTAVKSCCL